MIEEKTKHIQIAEYNYPLPDERIAKFPLAEREIGPRVERHIRKVRCAILFPKGEIRRGGDHRRVIRAQCRTRSVKRLSGRGACILQT